MSLKVTVLEGDLRGQSYLVESPSFSLGRGSEVDLTLKDASISKKHVHVEWDEKNIYILDLGSRNGIRHKGKIVNKVAFKKGEVLIGRLPVFFEIISDTSFPTVAPIPKGKIQDENQNSESGKQEDSTDSPVQASQILSLAALFLTVITILLWGFSDFFWPRVVESDDFFKIKESAPFLRITLPAPAADHLESLPEKKSFEVDFAPDSRRVLVITPFQVGEDHLRIPLNNGSYANYTIAVIPDNLSSQNKKILNLKRLSPKEKKSLLNDIKVAFQETKQLAEQNTLDAKIQAWKNCQWISKECRRFQLSPPEMLELGPIFNRLNLDLEKERIALFNDAKNSYNLYVSSHNIQDLDNALASLKRLLSFTNSTQTNWPKMKSFQEQLLILRRKAKR
jgi:hypothetical protein